MLSRRGVIFFRCVERKVQNTMRPIKQLAALPFVFSENGTVRVCLITSRDTGRWIVPKGWPKKGSASHEQAAYEAYEEAGLQGRIGKKSIGRYGYLKRLDDGSEVKCVVSVFALLVERQAKKWPEQEERRKLWVAPETAVDLVDDQELAAVIRSFQPQMKAWSSLEATSL